MPHRPEKLFEDILQAIHELEGFSENKTIREFAGDRMLQLAVERELEIIGEALFRMRKAAPEVLIKIPNSEKIIGLRNILAHGYDSLDHEILWDVVTNKLADLHTAISNLQQA